MIEDTPFVIVPIKSLHQGKSRLSSILDGDKRSELNTYLMRRTFDVISAYPGASRSIAISEDPLVEREAQVRGINFIEDRDRDLNAALGRAAREAIEKGAQAIMVLPVDLPLVTSEDLKRIRPEGCGGHCIIVPDRHKSGTNLLYLSPPADDIFRFGTGSFERHRKAALDRGFHTVELNDPTISIDIDEPADYERWRAWLKRDELRLNRFGIPKSAGF